MRVFRLQYKGRTQSHQSQAGWREVAASEPEESPDTLTGSWWQWWPVLRMINIGHLIPILATLGKRLDSKFPNYWLSFNYRVMHICIFIGKYLKSKDSPKDSIMTFKQNIYSIKTFTKRLRKVYQYINLPNNVSSNEIFDSNISGMSNSQSSH